jgi:arylsulfatase A
MTRLLSALPAFLLLVLAFSCSTESDRRPPNIIVILADDLGYGELGSYGQQIIKTPHLDRMAAEGMRFTRAYSGSTVCAPSRCALLTGKHMGHAYVRDNYELGGYTDETEGGQLPLDTAETTLAELLKTEGYATACIGKWGLGMADSTGDPALHGFDLFYGYFCQKQAHNYYPTHLWENGIWNTLNNTFFMAHQRLPEGADTTALTTYAPYKGNDYAAEHMQNKMLDFVRENKNQPFFLYYASPIPHLSLQVPDEELAPYAGLDEKPYPGGRGYLPHLKPRAAYAAMISRLDTGAGMLMNLLSELGLDENTLIIFTSDNGATIPGIGGVDTEFFDSYGGLRGWKTNLYEGGIRVPLIARWPGNIAAGKVEDRQTPVWDILPTVCEATGIEPPTGIDGLSYLPVLTGGEGRQNHENLYWEFHSGGSSQALIWGKWKAMRLNLKENPQAPIELYDLESDPAESTDVAAEHPDVVATMQRMLQESRTPSPIEGWNW